jgi:hypothetical protein
VIQVFLIQSIQCTGKGCHTELRGCADQWVGSYNHSEIENKEVSGGFVMKYLRDSAGIIPLILLMLVGIVGLFIFLLVRSC